MRNFTLEGRLLVGTRLRDARHLLAFGAEYQGAARAGLLLHSGNETRWIAPGVLAAPWWWVL